MSRLQELAGRATVTVPEAGRVLGIGRDAAYAAAERGEIPVLRLGRRLVVPVPRLLELLGAAPDMQAAGPATDPATANETHRRLQEVRRGQDSPSDAIEPGPFPRRARGRPA